MQVVGHTHFWMNNLKDEIKPFGKDWKYVFLKFKHHDITINKILTLKF